MEEKNSEKKERKMRDSGIPWIGEVPEGWGVSPLKYNYNIIAGATPDSTKQGFWDGNIKWITPADYKTKDVYVSSGKRNLTSAGYKACSTHMLPKASIVISKRAPIGSVAITASDLCTNQGCLGLVAKNKFVNNKYFYYVLSIYDDVLNLYGSGTTFKEISANVFSNIDFPLPSVAIQNSIADYLDSKCSEIDALIENLHARMESAKEYKKAVITKAVTKGLDKDVKMKDSGVEWIGDIPEGWKVVKLKQYIKNVSSGLSAVTSDSSEDSGKYILRTSAVSSEKFIESEVKSVTKQAESRLICPVEADTVIMSRMNTSAMVGACAYVARNYENLFVPDKLWKIKFTLELSAKYAWYLINSAPIRGWFSSISTGASASMQNISLTDFYNAYAPIPRLIEQRQISDYLDSKCSEIDALLQNYEDQIVTLEEYKKSLIYEYVTGKKEVPET
mgnify:CR=1 FL=1